MNHPFFRSQRRPGLFAGPQQVQEQEEDEKDEKKLSFFERFAQVFTGPRDERLSDDQNKKARDEALLQAGVAMLAAGGRTGLQRASTLSALAEGIQAGRGAGSTARRGSVIGGLAGEDPSVALPQFRQLFIEALQAGDDEGARSIATVINAMEASGSKLNKQDQFIYRTVGSSIIVIDPTTGQEISRIQGPKDAGKSGKPEVIFNPATGQNQLAIWRPDVMAYFDLDGNAIPDVEPKRSVSEKQDDRAGQIASLQAGLDFVREHGRPLPSDVAFGVNVLNDLSQGLLPEVGTEWLARTEPIVLILTRLYQGGRPTDKDIELSRNIFIPKLTDTNAAVNAKIDAIQRALDAFNAGRPAPAFSSLPQGVDPRSIVAEGRESDSPIADQFRNQ